MKTLLLFFILITTPGWLVAQHSLTGVWAGNLTNDSVTISQEQSFEIALTQYKEKVYGYSRRSFLVNDTLYYVLKRVKGKVVGDVCEITDDEIISYNFPGRLDKGVKVTTTFRMNKEDTSWHLTGEWKTNKTKRYGFYAITGKTFLKEQTDLSQSKILPHLDELNLAKGIPFYAATKQTTPVTNSDTAIAEVMITKHKETDQTTKADKKTSRKDQSQNNKADVAVTATAPPIKKDSSIAKQLPLANTNTNVNAIVAAAKVKERITLPTPEQVEFTTDSIELALYDNGEIDGDTVSVLLNGEIILARQGLKASAIKKKIYIAPGTDSASLILYAENLGKYPPNTGLLVVRDGGNVYQIRFSADLKQNAEIIFRRRR